MKQPTEPRTCHYMLMINSQHNQGHNTIQVKGKKSNKTKNTKQNNTIMIAK